MQTIETEATILFQIYKLSILENFVEVQDSIHRFMVFHSGVINLGEALNLYSTSPFHVNKAMNVFSKGSVQNWKSGLVEGIGSFLPKLENES